MQLKNTIEVVAALVVGFIIAVVAITVYRNVREQVEGVISPAKTDTVWMAPTAVDEAVKKAREPWKPTIVERITTQEIRPDTVYIARNDTIYSPEDLPAYGMQEVRKEGDKLTVTALARDGTEVDSLKYTLPSSSANYLLKSGASPAILRTSRTIDLLDIDVGVGVLVGQSGATILLQGPVALKVSRNTRVTPVALVDQDGWSVGGTYNYRH